MFKRRRDYNLLKKIAGLQGRQVELEDHYNELRDMVLLQQRKIKNLESLVVRMSKKEIEQKEVQLQVIVSDLLIDGYFDKKYSNEDIFDTVQQNFKEEIDTIQILLPEGEREYPMRVIKKGDKVENVVYLIRQETADKLQDEIKG